MVITLLLNDSLVFIILDTKKRANIARFDSY
jgi:hypothetical protein